MFELFLLLIVLVATFAAGAKYGQTVEKAAIADIVTEYDNIAKQGAVTWADVRGRIVAHL